MPIPSYVVRSIGLSANTTVINVGGGGVPQGTYTCTATEAVGDVVFINSSGNAERADADDLATLPAIGMISAKDGDTSCTVQFGAELEFSRTPDLLPGRRYYVHSLGAIHTPEDGFSAKAYWQVAGFAKTSSILVLTFGAVIPIGT